ncbi:GNAT family N-acetyltransferase [Actinocorallia longicatena]|uniref:GNAT family N-acetyltransferase n=1 Tax=Actinocorallia longicatena TaxID=111803 RepID=A0ABP6QNP6_9ACTN
MRFEISVLDESEISLCQDLAEDRNWTREEEKWRLLFRAGTVFGVRAPDGDGLAAMAVATRYGDTATAISMVVTAARYERRGLGALLMRHILATCGTPTSVLTATAYGRPLYERLGFAARGAVTVFFGEPVAGETGLTRAATPDDLDTIAALDLEAFGASRREILGELLTRHGLGFRIAEGPTGALGFAGAWRYDGITLLGPAVADGPETAIALITDLIATTPGPYRLELGDHQTEVVAWAEKLGFAARFGVPVMEHGPALRDRRERQFGTIALAFG